MMQSSDNHLHHRDGAGGGVGAGGSSGGGGGGGEMEMEELNESGGGAGADGGEVESLLIPAGADDSGSTKKRVVMKKSDGTGEGTPGGSGGAIKKKGRKTSSSAAADENAAAVFIKYFALFLLVAQMVGLVLLMRYSRTQKREPGQPLYLASTAVFIMEVMKLVICLGVIAVQSGGALLSEMYLHVIQSPMEIVKLTVPSLLYTVQNNLLYLALTNLDAATYQVCYQLKILTTALFSAILLHRKFSAQKWLSLVILTVGVAIVQISGSGDQHTQAATASAAAASDNSSHHHHNQNADGIFQEGPSADADGSGTTSHPLVARAVQELAQAAADQASHNRVVGLIAVLCAACTSGFSGVYFEKILKGSRTSLWIRNVQMGLPSIVIAYFTVYIKDSVAVREQGFLGGYTKIVWTVVTVQAVGGLIVATVVKYADNVLKVFATSFSIVVSCIISAFLFDFHPNLSFLIGASLVVTATVMYSSPERAKRTRKPLLPTSTGAPSSRK